MELFLYAVSHVLPSNFFASTTVGRARLKWVASAKNSHGGGVGGEGGEGGGVLQACRSSLMVHLSVLLLYSHMR